MAYPEKEGSTKCWSIWPSLVILKLTDELYPRKIWTKKGTKDQVPGTKIEIPNIGNWKIAGL